MRNGDGIKLPAKLLEQLGGTNDQHSRNRSKLGHQTRKDARHAARIAIKQQRSVAHERRPQRQALAKRDHATETKKEQTPQASSQHHTIRKRDKASGHRVSKEDKVIEALAVQLPTNQAIRPKTSRKTQALLDQDDAEIKELEKALGIKNRKTLPKAFEDDGLSTLLEGLNDGGPTSSGAVEKRKRKEEQEWFASKRRAVATQQADPNQESSDDLDDIDDFGGFESDSQASNETDDDSGLSNDGVGSSEDESEDMVAKGIFEDEVSTEEDVPKRKPRENPYVAPQVESSSKLSTAKYIPPSMRQTSSTETQDQIVLRRRIQGLLNRLSGANLHSITAEVQALYQRHARQDVTTLIIDNIAGQLADPAALEDTFVVLQTGFFAALYKLLGTAFGAQVLVRLDEDFQKFYTNRHLDHHSKSLINVMNALAQMYNFQVISSRLMYDYIRFLLADFSEASTELLLKIVRVAGYQLRHDDPAALKEISAQLNAVAVQAGTANLSVRTRFMIETIEDLKNNKSKKGLAAAEVLSDHIASMKKTLGRTDQTRSQTNEPLGIALADLRDSEKRGKWWLVGASWKSQSQPDQSARSDSTATATANKKTDTPDLIDLARQQRMNTDIRRLIFATIMSASDYNDAYHRLEALRLSKTQRHQIPRVILHCAGAETPSNPYYTVLARRLCENKGVKKALQFSLWDLFKRMGEPGTLDAQDQDDSDDTEGEEQKGGQTVDTRTMLNLAQFYASLVLTETLDLGILKIVNLAQLKPRTQIFLELFFVKIMLLETDDAAGRPVGLSERERSEKLLRVFLTYRDIADMAVQLQWFLKRVLRKTDVVESKADRDTLRLGCRIVSQALVGVVAAAAERESAAV